MSILKLIETAPQHFQLEGELSFKSINQQTLLLLNLETSASPLYLDLQALSKIDSAGVALLIEWIKFAKIHQIELLFEHLPAQLIALLELSYLSDCKLFITRDMKTHG